VADVLVDVALYCVGNVDGCVGDVDGDVELDPECVPADGGRNAVVLIGPVLTAGILEVSECGWAEPGQEAQKCWFEPATLG
jgi:hypothetical protein